MVPKYTGADLFVDALESYGVSHVFGNPGTTELPVLNALAESDLEYVLGLHEDVAVGMAGGYASTRRYHADDDSSINPAGVVNLHIAPGLAHGLGNVYAAKMAGAPLVVTAGNHERDFRHEEPILSGDLLELTQQFCKWSEEVLDVNALPTMLRRAFRVALTPPTGPVFLGLPMDVMRAEIDPEAIEPLGPIPTAGGGDHDQIERAAALLADANDPALIVGDHVARAGEQAVDAAVDLAEAAGARVHGEIQTSEINFPTDHDQWISFVPPNEEIASKVLETDTLVFAGVSSNTTLLRHDDPLVDADTTCIHLSDAPWEVGKNQRADAAVIGDPGAVMADLADRVSSRLSEGEHETRLEHVRSVRESMDEAAESMGVDEKPDGETRAGKHELVDALEAVAPDALIVDEGVTSKYPLLTRFPFSPQQLLSNKGGGLGYGLPASVGAALAESMREESRDVIGYVGDGSYLYYPNSVYTAARYGLDLTVVVADNRNYRILKDNMQRLYGGTDEDFEYVGMDFEPAVDLVQSAESHGAHARLVETPDEIESAISEALAHDGPDVLDVLVHD
ncbi:thiamine pyrophosphate-binding protein [Halostagnicola kamekurae]|uniref:Benzoylformate decarboxylase n=1 Tax=Halostagnicola kamekurae TaxID=619731 RepID=A0A1I6PBK1_9EURY|nr:thiamine pyrophosphate-binding protein [Halostagnicola kamekurae]SFS37515.1 benzoylformate decarboxylase [Halostagnicola kamekurae]